MPSEKTTIHTQSRRKGCVKTETKVTAGKTSYCRCYLIFYIELTKFFFRVFLLISYSIIC